MKQEGRASPCWTLAEDMYIRWLKSSAICHDVMSRWTESSKSINFVVTNTFEWVGKLVNTESINTWLISFKELAHMIVEASKFTTQKAGQWAGAWAGADAVVLVKNLSFLRGTLSLALRDFPLVSRGPPILLSRISFLWSWLLVNINHIYRMYPRATSRWMFAWLTG